MRKFIWILTGLVLSGGLSAQGNLDLEWWVEYKKDSDSGELLRVAAAVPGAVQLDIASAEGYGPYYYADNWRDYLWMEDHEFTYVTRFFKPRMDPGERLVFRSLGIDYEFEIILNGEVLLHQEGMFTPVRLDLTSRLQVNNSLKIKIFPVPKKHPEPADRSQAAASVKPAVSYGWDWHPRLIPSGIWEDTWLEILPGSHVEDISVRYSLNEELDKAFIRVDARGRNLGECKIAWNLFGSDGIKVNMGYLNTYQDQGVLYSELANPVLWWPHDHGDPHLYSYTLVLTDPSGKLLETHSGHIGFRRVKLLMNEGAWNEPVGFPKTRSVAPIQLEINGRKIFCKGSNWVNPEIFPGTIRPSRYAELIDLALEANFNMLRVWGGGIVNKEVFYDLCDKKGILVWQEFPLACNNYEDNPEYLEVLEQESESIIRRIREHPSLAIWSGGNELFNAWSGMSDQSLAIRMLNSQCLQLDPNTPFISTSPLMGMGHGHYVFRDPVTGEEVYSIMQRARHTAYTEFGVPGPSPVAILETIIPPEDLWPPAPGTAWESHHAYNAWVGDTWLMKDMIEGYFGKAKSLDLLVEKGQLLQSEGYKAIYEEARRQKPYCSMVLNWCFNEPWPAAANNSLISWPNWPKPAFSAVRNACRPVLASARNYQLKWRREEFFSTQLWILNDSYQELEAGVMKAILMSGNKLKELGTWEFGKVSANSNLEGPVLKKLLPRWRSDGFILLLEVEGHPEYSSSYSFILSD
ncbi:MAG: glycoside hydrolase family 2 TIM barrel-domain containing protein [Bacteroidales bacterium]|nr:glycoside hydrolase family 2 TIM barrel-domain containing protein [Bacteroidales bacterium]